MIKVKQELIKKIYYQNIIIAIVQIFQYSPEITALNFKKYLTKSEENEFNALTSEIKKKSYVLGRYTAKQTISLLIRDKNLRDIEITKGILGQPVVHIKSKKNVEISISHERDVYASVAFLYEFPFGIDIERVTHKNLAVLIRCSSKEERLNVKYLEMTSIESLTLLWTTKEALSKILKTGLTLPFWFYEIKGCNFVANNHIVSSYKYFSQYISISFVIKDFICTFTCPHLKNIHIE